MRLRLTIVTALALVVLMSGAGAGLASQGLGQTGDNASVAQYGESNQPERSGTQGGGVLGQTERSVNPTSGFQPDRTLGVAPPIDEVQPARQVEAGGSLPFTGFPAIPLLLLGASLLATGLVLHRNAPRGD